MRTVRKNPLSTALFSGGSAGRESANRLSCGDTEIREPRAESREPRAESREPRAESREPRAESREPRAESREPRAESREPRAESRSSCPPGRVMPRLSGSRSGRPPSSLPSAPLRGAVRPPSDRPARRRACIAASRACLRRPSPAPGTRRPLPERLHPPRRGGAAVGRLGESRCRPRRGAGSPRLGRPRPGPAGPSRHAAPGVCRRAGVRLPRVRRPACRPPDRARGRQGDLFAHADRGSHVVGDINHVRFPSDPQLTGGSLGTDRPKDNPRIQVNRREPQRPLDNDLNQRQCIGRDAH